MGDLLCDHRDVGQKRADSIMVISGGLSVMLACKFIKLMSLNLQETKLYQFFPNSKDQEQLLGAERGIHY